MPKFVNISKTNKAHLVNIELITQIKAMNYGQVEQCSIYFDASEKHAVAEMSYDELATLIANSWPDAQPRN